MIVNYPLEKRNILRWIVGYWDKHPSRNRYRIQDPVSMKDASVDRGPRYLASTLKSSLMLEDEARVGHA